MKFINISYPNTSIINQNQNQNLINNLVSECVQNNNYNSQNNQIDTITYDIKNTKTMDKKKNENLNSDDNDNDNDKIKVINTNNDNIAKICKSNLLKLMDDIDLNEKMKRNFNIEDNYDF